MKLAFLTAAVSFLTGVSAVALVLHPGNRDENNSETTTPSSESADSKVVRSMNIIDFREGDETATYDEVETMNSPFEGVEVELTGMQDRWQVRYWDRASRQFLVPEAANQFDDTTVVHLPANTVVRMSLKSLDFVYMLSLPRIHKSQIACPGRDFHVDFRLLSPGIFYLPGNHVCGPPKPLLTVTVQVDPKPEFIAWLQKQSRSTNPHGGNDP